jgi:hypothetical protein
MATISHVTTPSALPQSTDNLTREYNNRCQNAIAFSIVFRAFFERPAAVLLELKSTHKIAERYDKWRLLK